MRSFSLRTIAKQMPRMTQAFHAGLSLNEAPTLGSARRAVSFNVANMASHNSAFYYTMGKGVVAPAQLQAVMYHYAQTNPAVESFASLMDDYRAFHFAASTNVDVWRRLVAFVTGQANERAVESKKWGKMPARAIRNRLLKEVNEAKITSPHLPMFVNILAEFVIAWFAELGLVLPSVPYTYRVKRIAAFPDYAAYEDAVRGKVFMTMLESLAAADLSLLKNEIKKGSPTSPSYIANQMGQACLTAYDRVRSHYDPEQVTAAVASVLWRVWSPITPADVVPRERVQTAEGFAKLMNNVTFFVAVQRRIAEQGLPVCDFDDETMASVILPMFNEALATASPYKERTIDECISHLGMRHHRDYDGTRTHVALFESWVFSTGADAFTPVRNSEDESERFLMTESRIADAISTALKPVSTSFDVTSLVDGYLSAVEMATPGSYKVAANGTEMLIAFPSATAVEAAEGLEAVIFALLSDPSEDGAAATKALEEHPAVAGQSEGETRAALTRRLGASARVVAGSYYLSTLLFAIAKGGEIALTPAKTRSDADTLVITFGCMSESPVPLGSSAVLNGRVETIEPAERLAYHTEVVPTCSLSTDSLSLVDHERSLHVWDWRASSQPLQFMDRFPTTVAGVNVAVQVDEVVILGLGHSRPRLRFAVSTSARAVMKMWVEWYLSTLSALRALHKITKDSAARSAIEGRILAMQISLLNRIRQVGSSVVGENVIRRVNRQITEELYGRGKIDAMKQIYATPHRVQLESWAGFTVLQMLGLIDPTSEAAPLINDLRDSSALTTVVAMSDVVS